MKLLGTTISHLERHYIKVVVLLLLIYSVQVLYAVHAYTQTIDEWTHVNMAYRYLTTGRYDMVIEHTPLRMLNVLPFLSYFPEVKDPDKWYGIGGEELEIMLKKVRIVTLLYGLLLGIFIFLWAKELFGVRAGLLALLLYAFEPTVIAHSSLATTDILLSCFIFISTYFLYKFLRNPCLKNATLLGLSVGLALISKFTAVFLLPLYLAFALLYVRKENFLRYLIFAFVIIIIPLIIINGAYAFKGTFNTLDSYAFKWKVLADIAKTFPNLPVPLPQMYLIGFDSAKIQSEKYYGPMYFLGKNTADGLGWRLYYLVAFLLKTPVPLLVLIVASLPVLFRNPRKQLLFLLISPIVFFLTISLLSAVNTGIRYVLPAYAFLIVLASATVLYKSKLAKIILFSLLVWYVTSAVLTTPDYLSYFNEFIGGSKNGWKYLGDSNIDWGQGQKIARKFIENSNILVKGGIGCEYVSGRVIISANELLDYFSSNKECHSWLRNEKPIGETGGYIIFDVPEKECTNNCSVSQTSQGT